MGPRFAIGLGGGLAILFSSLLALAPLRTFSAQSVPPGANLKALQILHFDGNYVDPYHALGVLPDASEDAIKEAFRIQIAYAHPDRASQEFERRARRLTFAKDRLLKHRSAVNLALRAMFQDWPRTQQQRYQQAVKDREARVSLAREQAQATRRMQEEAEAAKRAALREEEARRAKYAPPPNAARSGARVEGAKAGSVASESLAQQRAAKALKAYGSVRETAIPGCENAYGRIIDVFDDRIPLANTPK